MAKKRENPILSCPVCLSDRLDTISVRMKKCTSCGFIWNHDVSDRDNILLILEHQAKREVTQIAPVPVVVPKIAKRATKAKSVKPKVATPASRRVRMAR
jgi:hypothetical protein